MRVIAAAVVCCLFTMIAPQAFAQQPCPALVVANASDVVNGDTSSPCALIASPGADGISLREAIAAANNAVGPGAITITFAPTLAGQTITPNTGCCYTITRDSVAIVGLVDSNGQPTVTINAAKVPLFLFSVTASNFTLKSMNIIGLGAMATDGSMLGVFVRAGETASQGSWKNPGDELQVSNTVIEDNLFSNTPGQATVVIAVVVGVAYPNAAANAVFSNAVIANNTFTFTQLGSGSTTEAVGVKAQGTNSTVQNVSILHNTFNNPQYGIELVPADLSNGGRILNTRIAANSFGAYQQFAVASAVIIDPSGDDGLPSTNNTVDGTVIQGNIITGIAGPAISLIGGIGNGSTVSATGNAITNTSIINNLITGDTVYGGFSITGGRQGSSGNSVSGVKIVNNTIANYAGVQGDGGAIDASANLSGGTGNTVSGITVLNTILWNNTPLDFTGTPGIAPSQVTTSITAQSGYAGVNGNIASNPQFVNPSNNFGLQTGSPARHAGTASGAPAIDIDCQPRGSPPSIGAYELDGPNVCSVWNNKSAATHDLNGDGFSDVVWRDNAGDLAVWLMNGTRVLQAAALGNVSNTWTVIGQHDFNGDGESDLVWRGGGGDLAMWLMNGSQVSSLASLGNVPVNWTVYGTGDLNGDGYGDLLWRDSNTGTVVAWLMNGAAVASTANFGAVAPNWTILGDANGGVLWRDNSGDLALWQMQEAQVANACSLGNVSANWLVQGVGDFNGDGNLDILWRDSNTGTVAIWLLVNGCQVQSSITLGAVSISTWTIAQIGDYNGDGTSDIFWMDSSGNAAVWFMNNGEVSSASVLGGVGGTWQVQNANAN